MSPFVTPFCHSLLSLPFVTYYRVSLQGFTPVSCPLLSVMCNRHQHSAVGGALTPSPEVASAVLRPYPVASKRRQATARRAALLPETHRALSSAAPSTRGSPAGRSTPTFLPGIEQLQRPSSCFTFHRDGNSGLVRGRDWVPRRLETILQDGAHNAVVGGVTGGTEHRDKSAVHRDKR